MNWTHVISELGKLGYSQPRIAQECACAQATVSDLATGETKNPRFNTAQALLDLLEKARAAAGKQKRAA